MSKRLFAVLGDPISHSLSPKIHAAAYDYLNLDYNYEAIRVSAGTLQRFISQEGSKFSGFSITMPLKFEAAELATDSILLGTGVCNTLVRNETGFSGYNTDIYGIHMAVKIAQRAPIKNIAVLGSGATARSAVVAALGMSEVSNISVFARNTEKASSLKHLVSDTPVSFEAKSLSEFSGGFDLTLNTLPGGAANSLHVSTGQTGLLLSAGYYTEDFEFTKNFLRDHQIPGTEMLIWQAVQQVKLFVGQDIDAKRIDEVTLAEVMRQAL
jgi:shikimate dehydrogenase